MDEAVSQPSAAPSAARQSRPWGTVAAVAILLVAGAAAYSNSFHGPFTFDDLALIPDNPDLRGDWSPWHLAFSSNFRTRPVIALTVAMNYALGGLDVRGYHAVNLIIHLLAALALFGAGRRLVHRRAVSRRHWPGGAGRCILRPSGTHPEPAGALKKAGIFQAEHTDGGDLSRWGIATRA